MYIRAIKVNFIAALVILTAIPLANVHASTVLSVGFDELAQRAELIFEGQVTSTETRRSVVNSAPMTYFTFQVIDVIKGVHSGEVIELGFAGGTIDGLTMEVSDMRMPEAGERGIYFVESVNAELVHPLYGWSQGHYLVTMDNERSVGRVIPVLDSGMALQSAPTLGDFKQTIRTKIGGVIE
jgi:hypothetical protein